MYQKQYHNIFFLGIGGIGMSALARYFKACGKNVAGYDRTASKLTVQLSHEGIPVTYLDERASVPNKFVDTSKTLIVFTPALQDNSKLLNFFRASHFSILKRSEILGLISCEFKTIAVAGTHGKTTVSTMIAHLLTQSGVGCLAILGGGSKNYNTNYFQTAQPTYFVTEADEFDRSFLKLKPFVEVITSADADHLDIYGNELELKLCFGEFISKLQSNGTLVIKEGLDLVIKVNLCRSLYSYGLTGGDFYAENLRMFADHTAFDMITPTGRMENLILGIPGQINVENAVAAVVVAINVGASRDEIRLGLQSFKGIRRRFEVQFVSEQKVYIDDYAHHPNEIVALVDSVRPIFPGRKITGVFQPHLFSRTKDFSAGFAESLDLLDEVILLDIYPAREKPIEGVTSNMIFEQMKIKQKHMCNKANLLAELKGMEYQILLTIGAGDIGQMVQPIIKMLFETSKTI